MRKSTRAFRAGAGGLISILGGCTANNFSIAPSFNGDKTELVAAYNSKFDSRILNNNMTESQKTLIKIPSKYLMSEKEILASPASMDDNVDSKTFTPLEIARLEVLSRLNYRVFIKNISTVREAAIYSTRIVKTGEDADMKRWCVPDYWACLAEVLGRPDLEVDCEDVADVNAGALKDDGFTPCTLWINWKKYVHNPRMHVKEEIVGHSVYPYRGKEGFFGSIGCSDRDINPPIYNSIKDLAEAVSSAHGGTLTCYALCRLPDDIEDNFRNNSPVP